MKVIFVLMIMIVLPDVFLSLFLFCNGSVDMYTGTCMLSLHCVMVFPLCVSILIEFTTLKGPLFFKNS